MEAADFVHFECHDKIHVVSLTNTRRLDQSNHEAFGAALLSFLEQHPGAHLLVSLDGIEFISSAVLSELIQAMRLATRQGGSVRVCALNSYVASVFEVTHLDKTFHAGGTQQEAIARFHEDLNTVKA